MLILLRVWLVTSLFYAFQFFLRSTPNALAPYLCNKFSIDAVGLGHLSAAYFMPYMLMQVPLGVALDLWGPKRILRAGVVVCVAGAFLWALAGTLHQAWYGRMLIGLGGAVSFIGSMRMNTLWLSGAYLALGLGGLSAVGKLGGAAANSFLPTWLIYAPWPVVGTVWACLGACLAVGVWLWAKNGPDDHFIPVANRVISVGQALGHVLCSPIVWAMGLYGYTLYLVLTVFADTYSIGFLSLRMGMSAVQAGHWAWLVGLGSAMGSGLVSYCSARWGGKLLWVKLCAGGTLVISTLLFFGPGGCSDALAPAGATAMCQAKSLGCLSHPWLIGSLLFAFGLCSGGQILAFLVALERLPARMAGMASGVVNSFLMAGGAFHNPLVGRVMRWSYQARAGDMTLESTAYQLADYRWAFATLSLFFLLNFLVVSRLKFDNLACEPT